MKLFKKKKKIKKIITKTSEQAKIELAEQAKIELDRKTCPSCGYFSNYNYISYDCDYKIFKSLWYRRYKCIKCNTEWVVYDE